MGDLSPAAKQLLRELIILRRRENRDLILNAEAEVSKAFKSNFEHEEQVLNELWKEADNG